MTNLQLFIAIIVPMLFNGALIALVNNNMNARISSVEARLLAFENSFNARLDLLTGKVAELTDRLTRLEARHE